MSDPEGRPTVLDLVPEGIDGIITVYTSAPWKGNPAPAGRIELRAGMPETPVRMTADVTGVTALSGKHPLYLTFSSPVKGKSLCTITHLQFQSE